MSIKFFYRNLALQMYIYISNSINEFWFQWKQLDVALSMRKCDVCRFMNVHMFCNVCSHGDCNIYVYIASYTRKQYS